jgi:spermidine synthase
MNQSIRRTLFLLFFLSGFCSLVYQVVWTRMAFASFGIITPVLSIVLSVFMLGLAVGSWAGGRWIGLLTRKTGLSPAIFYGLAELLIGLGAFAVPKLFALGENLLLTSGEMDSFRYLSLSALVLAVSILPSCLCMGTTFPLMMAYIRERDDRVADSFSFLYLANVLGAMSGTFTTAALLVEVLGFHQTLWVAAAGNFAIASISVALGWKQRSATRPVEAKTQPARAGVISGAGRDLGVKRLILFSTGCIAMAMEVVWTRAFTPVLKTQVYSFALIVFTYLGATFVGSWLYRRHLRQGRLFSTLDLMAMLTVAAFLPIIINDPRLVPSHWSDWSYPRGVCILLFSICPFCALLGYLTPGLIDEYAAGHPVAAGQAYAINVLGCILGPLIAGYILLPWLSERHALILLNLPFAGFYLWLARAHFRPRHLAWGLAAGVVLMWSLFFSQDFEGMLLLTEKNTTIRRDHVASVISYGDTRGGKRLLVNGVGMTGLTSLTKLMMDLPLSYHSGQPKSVLVICFGMGTSYRSALNWNIDTTAVELVPSVPRAFDFYHADAGKCITNSLGRIVVDDGRRFLKRTSRKFDVITVDPPPPVEAAGSSLLFSREFYVLAKQHLNPGGVLQMWFPGDNRQTEAAVARSIHEAFPYVRCFRAVEGAGWHHLASMEPIPALDARQLAGRMSDLVKQDLIEWVDFADASGYLEQVLAKEVPLDSLLVPNSQVQVTDDRPYNEYYLLRKLKARFAPAPVRLSAGF